jgi:cyclic pyranopterin phosphate synthase
MPPQRIDLLSHEEMLRYEEIVRIARAALALGIRKIRLTGGEPLVRKDLQTLIRGLAMLPGIQDLSMTTNGIRLAECAAILRKAGLQRVNVSMDSLNPERYATLTSGGDLNRVWNGLMAALKVDMSPVKINMVSLKGLNADEIIPFARLALRWPFEVRFIEWMPIGRDLGWEPGAFISGDRILTRIREVFHLEPVLTKSGNGSARVFKLAGGDGTVGVISPLTRHFCEKCNRLRLTADGKLRGCLFSDEEIDLKTIIRDGASDEVIKMHLQEAIRLKPPGHNLLDGDSRIKKCMRPMNQIGG